MVSILAALLFSAAFTASFWAMYITIAPRIGYMRALLNGGTIPDLAPAVAPRGRGVMRPAAVSTMTLRPLRAVA